MPGYTVRTPYRVDEPKLGFEEHELPGITWMRAEPNGCLIGGRDGSGDDDPSDGVVYRFAHGSWTSCTFGPFKDET